MKRNGLLSIFLALCLLAGMLLSCKAGSGAGKTLGAQSAPAKQFAKALTENQYANAIAAWNKKIAGDAALETEAQACIRTYLSEMERGVFSGEYSAADITVKRATIDKVCSALGFAPDDYDALCAKIDAALASKAAYQSGCSLEQAGHLADALAEYGKVLAQDPDYADAAARSTAVAAQLKTDALQAAEQALEQDDIKTALNVLRQAQQQLGEDAEIGAKLKTAEAEYAARVKADADAAFSEYTAYEDALAIIEEGLRVFPEQQTLLAQRDYYRSFAPVNLCSMKEYSNNNMEVEKTYEDARGTAHTDVLGIRSMFLSGGTGEVVYVLDGKYNTLTFTVFGVDVDYDYLTAVSMRDYSCGNYDDSVILYRDEQLSCAALPFEVTVDVSGVELLRVYTGTGIAVADATLQRTEK